MKIDKEATRKLGVKVLRDEKKVQLKVEEPKKAERKSKKDREESFDSEPISFRDED